MSLSELIKTKANKDDKPNDDKAISESDVIAEDTENERNVLDSERQTLNSAQKQAENNESERINTSLKLDLSNM